MSDYQPLYIANDKTVTSVSNELSDIKFIKQNNNINTISAKTFLNKNQNEDLNLSSFNGTTINPIIQINNTTQKINITNDVGIGVNIPGQKLHIEGNIRLSQDGNFEHNTRTIEWYANGSTAVCGHIKMADSNLIIEPKGGGTSTIIKSKLEVNKNLENETKSTWTAKSYGHDTVDSLSTVRFYTGKTDANLPYGPNKKTYIDIGGYLHNGGSLYPVITTNYHNLYFATNNQYIAYIKYTGTASQLNFTGQHRSKIINIDINNITDYIGMIVISIGNLDNLDENINEFKPNINESLPIVELSNKKKDKKVFGVLSDIEDDNNNNREYSIGNFVSIYPKKNSNDNRVFINSVGEGALWIVNTNGNLENGDYIQSSDVIGYGEKQDDDILHNYTVAKITIDCTFDVNSSNYNCVEFIDSVSGNTYKKAFVGCTYHCG